MLDNGISFRCMLTYFAGIAAAVFTVALWVTNDNRFGVMSLTFTIVTAAMLVLTDSAKTRRIVRLAMIQSERPGVTPLR
jgi:hypothetical protein